MNKKIKTFIKTNSDILSRLYYLLMDNRIKGGKGNVFCHKNVFIRGLRIRFYGKDNSVMIGGGENPAFLRNCRIAIHGSHNKVIIEEGVGAKDLTIYLGNEHCLIHIKADTQISGKTELATMEGKSIVVGKDCLFSANITLRAGDSHSVIDADSGIRLNKSKDIVIGDHVWLGNTVILTKGTIIGNHSVVATGSVVTGKSFPDNCAIGGNPATIVKEGVSWDTKLL